MSYVGDGVLGTVGFSAAFGGLSAVATGGDFWRGAAVGATVGLLNHASDKVRDWHSFKTAQAKIQAVLEEIYKALQQGLETINLDTVLPGVGCKFIARNGYYDITIAGEKIQVTMMTIPRTKSTTELKILTGHRGPEQAGSHEKTNFSYWNSRAHIQTSAPNSAALWIQINKISEAVFLKFFPGMPPKENLNAW
jgi:hypothetical protein